uniref:Phosphoglycerate-bisphosphoglycerate mutase family M protein n=1 Tax=Philodina roseola TaxID=96448 RepID=B2L3J3_PHIRO|nr:phosphoglycerate-bisphosphoglycerate mutase family M protein [Philodina roseola]
MIFILLVCLIAPILVWLYSNPRFINWLCWRIAARAKAFRFRHFPKRIILIRHGESQGNEDATMYSTKPDHAIGLTTRGQQQARECGETLRKLFGDDESVMFYVSPFRRSRETCELICKAFLPERILKVREDPRIREQEWGNFQDAATRDTVVVERKKIGRFFYRFKDGESGADVYDRVSSFMESLYREMEDCKMANANVCIVSHGLFVRLFLTRYYRWSVEKFHTLENFDNCGFCILERDNEKEKFVLKTELKARSVEEEKEKVRAATRGSFSEQSFEAEAHPITNVADIPQEKPQN